MATPWHVYNLNACWLAGGSQSLHTGLQGHPDQAVPLQRRKQHRGKVAEPGCSLGGGQRSPHLSSRELGLSPRPWAAGPLRPSRPAPRTAGPVPGPAQTGLRQKGSLAPQNCPLAEGSPNGASCSQLPSRTPQRAAEVTQLPAPLLPACVAHLPFTVLVPTDGGLLKWSPPPAPLALAWRLAS